jgi:hypothetical protein
LFEAAPKKKRRKKKDKGKAKRDLSHDMVVTMESKSMDGETNIYIN